MAGKGQHDKMLMVAPNNHNRWPPVHTQMKSFPTASCVCVCVSLWRSEWVERLWEDRTIILMYPAWQNQGKLPRKHALLLSVTMATWILKVLRASCEGEDGPLKMFLLRPCCLRGVLWSFILRDKGIQRWREGRHSERNYINNISSKYSQLKLFSPIFNISSKCLEFTSPFVSSHLTFSEWKPKEIWVAGKNNNIKIIKKCPYQCGYR